MQLKTITSQTWCSKFNSKSEIYKFLSVDCGIFLPAYKVTTVDHLRKIAANQRKFIYSKNVRHFSLPHYEGLKMETIISWAKRYPDVTLALSSEPRDVDKLHR